jgi:hypothetical protein
MEQVEEEAKWADASSEEVKTLGCEKESQTHSWRRK